MSRNFAIPSFDTLEYKLKNFSFSRVNQERPKSSLIRSPGKEEQQNYSPLKFGGMQKK